MPLSTEVNVSPGHIVLDGVSALPERGTAAPPLFGPCLLRPLSPISAAAELLFSSSHFTFTADEWILVLSAGRIPLLQSPAERALIDQ